MVLQCSKLFYYKVSSEFLRQDSQSSYSFGKIQNVRERERETERDRDRDSKKIPVNHHDFRAVYSWKTAMQICLTLKAPIPKNGQTHSNNSSAICRRIVFVFDHFVKLALKGIKTMIYVLFLASRACAKDLEHVRRVKKTIRFHLYVLLLWIVININKFSFCYSHSALLECLYCWLWMHFFGLVTQNYH